MQEIRSYKYICLSICIILFLYIVWNCTCLENGGELQEYFQNSIDYSSKNICDFQKKCSVTRQRCLHDADCHSCHKPLDENVNTLHKVNNVIGQNDAGKLTFTQTPQYSILTTDIGSRSKLYKNNLNLYPVQYYNGVNKWRDVYDDGMELYNERYNVNSNNDDSSKFILSYPKRPTLSGQFIVDEPLASNAYL